MGQCAHPLQLRENTDMKAQQFLIELYEDDPINPLFDTTDTALTEMWDEVQKLQIELAFSVCKSKRWRL